MRIPKRLKAVKFDNVKVISGAGLTGKLKNDTYEFISQKIIPRNN